MIVLLLREVADQHRAKISQGKFTSLRPKPAYRRGDHRSEIHTAIYLLVVLTVGAYLPTPLYPRYQQIFGFGDLTMTLIYATFAVISAPALLLFGPAADTLGSRRVLRASVIAAALASACFAAADNSVWLLVGRAGQGLALGAATAAATGLIADRMPNKRRAAVLASMAFVAGTAAGPITAGLLAQYAPAPRLLPYLFHLGLLAIGWYRLAQLPGSGTGVGGWRPTRPRIPYGIRLRFGAAAATGFLAWTVAGLYLAIIPAVLGRAAQVTNLAVTGGIAAAVLACSVLVQPLVSGLGGRRAQLSGLGALAGSLLALTMTGGATLPVTMAAAVVAGAGHGLAYGGATATVDAAAPNGQRGAINAPLYLAFYLGAGIPAVAVGLLTLFQPLTTAISAVSAPAALLALLVAATIWLGHHSAPSAPTAPPGVMTSSIPSRRTGG